MLGAAKIAEKSHQLLKKELPLLLKSFSRGGTSIIKMGSRSSQFGVLMSGAVVVWSVCHDDDNRLIIK